MNKAEYWLLDAAIRLKLPLHWLAAGNLDELLNRPHHDLSASELLTVLERMFARGDLFAEHTDHARRSHRYRAFGRSEIEAALHMPPGAWMSQPQQIFYGVTARGGARWESFSNPQWDHFYDEQYGMDPHVGEITASTRSLIEERLALVPSEPCIRAILPGSVQWSVLQPWDATYWKRLTVGYHVEFSYLPLSDEDERACSFSPGQVPVHRWYTSHL